MTQNIEKRTEIAIGRFEVSASSANEFADTHSPEFTTPSGEKKTSVQAIIDKGMAAVSGTGGVDVGDYESNLKIGKYNEYVVFQRNESTPTQWKVKPSIPLPYDIDSVAYPTPQNDPNLQAYSDVNKDGVKNLISSSTDLAFNTVADMQAGRPIGGAAGDVVLKAGDLVRIKDRDNESFVITIKTANGFDIIDTTTGLAAEYVKNDAINDIAFGLKNDDTDEHVGLIAFFNSKYSELIIGGKGTGHNYKSSKTIQTGKNKTIYFRNKITIESIVQVDQGGVIGFDDGCVIYNPRVDGGGPDFIIGGSGQNGYGFQGKVIGYNFYAQNCARGNVAPYDGGKAIQSEAHAGADVTIFGLTAVNCHMASSSRRDGTDGTGNHLKVYDLNAINCNHIMFSGMANIDSVDPKDYSVIVSGVKAESCGALDNLPGANVGLFLYSRAANVSIDSVVISGTTKLEGIFRGRSRGCSVKSARIDQPCLGVVNIDPDPLYALDTKEPKDNKWDLDYQNICDYVLYSDITDNTYPNRFVSNSKLDIQLKNDVAVKFVTPATRNGDCVIIAKLGGKRIDSSTAGFNSNYHNMASVGTGLTVHHAQKIGSPNNDGLDMTSASGVVIDGILKTMNKNVTGTPYVAPVGDNANPLGWPTNRWKEVFAVNGTINTSDEREKTAFETITDKEKRVALKIKATIGKFQWLSALAIKGDAARMHFGVGAQAVKAAFESEGLDGFRYGVLCYDEWDNVHDETNDNVIIEAGNRYGIRYEQLLMFIIAAM